MSYSNLKAAISQVVRANGRREITGANLQSVLFGMVDSLGDGYAFKGIATPTYNPGTPDGKVFYLASENGTYTHFGSATLSNEVAIFSYDGSWHKLATGAARSAELTAEVNRASAAEGTLATAVNSKASASSLNSEIQRATLAEQALGGRIDTEKQRAEGVEGTLTTAVAAKYTKPVAGIPQTDLENGVQSKLNAVAGKYVKPSAGIPETDLDSSVRTKLNDRGGDTSLCVHLAGEETITGDKTFAGSADFNAGADFYGTPSFNADADIIDDNGETFGLVATAQAAAGAVRYDVDQSLQLSDTEKKTARNNIDAEGGAWKLIADTTISAQSAPVFTTFNDGTPLKAKEVVLYAFWETAHSSNDNGYFVVNTATYSNVRFGAFSMGNTYANRISKVYISTKSPIIEGYIASSEAYAIASVANNQICMGYSSSATPPYVGGEDITKVQIAPNAFTGTTRFMIYGR